jgi:hypothetical protein
MLYHATIPQSELDILASLLGSPLSVVVPNVWSAQLHAPNSLIKIIPEEVSAHDEDHWNGLVDRPKIIVETTPDPEREGSRIEPLGIMQDVSVITTLVTFTPTLPLPPLEIAPGVIVPQSEGYGSLYQDPAQLEAIQALQPEAEALIMLDIAVELTTTTHPSVVFYTSGYTIGISLNGLPDREWAKAEAYTRRSLIRPSGQAH